MSRLVTASIVGAVDWLTNCPPSWREKARQDLLNQLGRVWVEPEAGSSLNLGRTFEDQVYKWAAKGAVDSGTEHFKWFVAECKGGVFQKTLKKIVTIGEQDYCLYGKADIWFPGVIKDIKTTKRWKGREGYLKGFQHKLYCYASGVDAFRYIAAEFEDKVERPQILQHYAVDYIVKDRVELGESVMQTIDAFLDALGRDPEFWALYTTKFSRF